MDSFWRIPSVLEADGSLKMIISTVQKARKWKIADILFDFFNSHEDPGAYSMTGLNHVACYLGDYLEEKEVEQWHRFLLDRKDEGSLLSVDRGPSYISPKYYNTPGWWFSVKGEDGFVIEMFCCRHYGKWAELPPERRQSLMSHKAISIRSKDQVLSVLRRLADSRDHIELIAFTEGDELGHTYGHLRNNLNHKVLELVAS